MTDQVNTPEAGAQSQETTSEVDNQTTLEQMQQAEQQEPQEQQLVEEKAQKVVPLAALHEERAEKKRIKEQMRVMEERFNQLSQVVTQRLTPQQEQKQEVQIPDVSQDAIGHFRAKNELLERQLEQLGRPVQEIQQRMAQQEQYQRVQMHVRAQVNEYAKEKADVGEAITHAQNADFQALKALGYDDATAQQMVIQQYDQLVVGLIQQGRNVAEGMYALAQSKGYQPKQTAQEKLQGTQKVNQAARSLGNGGGVANKLSLAALAEMPADEFAKTIGDEAAWKKLWGG